MGLLSTSFKAAVLGDIQITPYPAQLSVVWMLNVSKNHETESARGQ